MPTPTQRSTRWGPGGPFLKHHVTWGDCLRWPAFRRMSSASISEIRVTNARINILILGGHFIASNLPCRAVTGEIINVTIMLGSINLTSLFGVSAFWIRRNSAGKYHWKGVLRDDRSHDWMKMVWKISCESKGDIGLTKLLVAAWILHHVLIKWFNSQKYCSQSFLLLFYAFCS